MELRVTRPRQLFGEEATERKVTTRVVLDVHDRLSSDLLGHVDPPVGDQGRPYWRPSSLGFCMRRQCLWRAGVAETRVEDEDQAADKERRFAWGRDLESHLVSRYDRAGLLVASQIPLADQELSLSGNADVLWGGPIAIDLPPRSRYWSDRFRSFVTTFRYELGELITEELPYVLTEIKTTHGHAVRKFVKEGIRYDHACQLGAYALMCERNAAQLPVKPERYELVIVGRDAVRPVIFGLRPSDIVEAEARIGELNDAWASGTWPDCTCGTTEGLSWEQNFCPYRDPEDPSACCGRTLLDRLEASLAVDR